MTNGKSQLSAVSVGRAMGRRRVLGGLGFAMLGGLAGCASGGQTSPSAAQPSRRERLRERIMARRGLTLPELPQGLPTAPYTDPRALPGSFEVQDLTGNWTDAARGNRVVPWRAYLPAAGGPAPTVIFSHGGGGTRDTGRQFGRHLASHGIASVHVQHAGSDIDAFREDAQQISRAARDPQYGAIRFQDIGFAADRLGESDGIPEGAVDPQRMGIYGHSFGAITTQIIAGQTVTGFGQSLALPSFRAAAALSPSPPRDGYGDAQTAFNDMLMPIAHLTGTEDHAPNGDFDAPARRIPFDQIDTVDQYLLVLDGANHFTFSGAENPELRGRSFAYPSLSRHHDIIRAMLTAFFKLELSGEAGQRDFLTAGGIGTALTPADLFATKSAA